MQAPRECACGTEGLRRTAVVSNISSPFGQNEWLVEEMYRKFRDDLGRLTLLRLFNLLGKDSELASRYRRRMFNYLH